LECVIAFDGEELANALAALLPPWQVVEIFSGVLRLFFDPLAGAQRVRLFEPPVRIRDWNSVKNLGDRFDRCKRGSRS